MTTVLEGERGPTGVGRGGGRGVGTRRVEPKVVEEEVAASRRGGAKSEGATPLAVGTRVEATGDAACDRRRR